MSLDPTAPAPKALPSASKTGGVAVLVAVGIGALVAVGLGVFGKVHDPRFFSVSVAGFSSGTAVKSWLPPSPFHWRSSSWCPHLRCTA